MLDRYVFTAVTSHNRLQTISRKVDVGKCFFALCAGEEEERVTKDVLKV